LTEDDVYALCVGNAMKRCLLDGVNSFDPQAGMLREDLKWIKCIEDKAKICTAPMMQHLMGMLKVYEKYLNELLKLEEM